MTMPPFDDLDDLRARGRVFYEMFPGAAASDAWRAAFTAAHQPHADANQSGSRTPSADAASSGDPIQRLAPSPVGAGRAS